MYNRYDAQLLQIDGTLSTIEGANTNTAVLTTMNDAAKALKRANNVRENISRTRIMLDFCSGS